MDEYKFGKCIEISTIISHCRASSHLSYFQGLVARVWFQESGADPAERIEVLLTQSFQNGKDWGQSLSEDHRPQVPNKTSRVILQLDNLGFKICFKKPHKNMTLIEFCCVFKKNKTSSSGIKGTL